jgi:uncharacterized membrane protein YbhN (UPF0104 family)
VNAPDAGAPDGTKPSRVSWQRALAWLVAGAILFLLFQRVQWPTVAAALEKGPYLLLAAYVLFEILIGLPVDAYATRAALAGAGVDRGFRELLLARGASYMLGVLSYFAGQGGVGVYLARKGVRAARATGAVLFLMVTNGLVLVWIAAAGLLLDPPDLGSPERTTALSILVVATLLGTLAYLGILRLRPAFLTRHAALAPLFQAGVPGHLRAAAARLPHMLLLAVLHWGAFRMWGIPVPFVRGVTLMPVVLLVAAVPITPSGLGTTQALQVLFFSPWSPEVGQAAREASVLAFSLVHQVFSLLGMALVGLLCLTRLDLEDGR